MSALEPCPFCGKSDKVTIYTESIAHCGKLLWIRYGVKCKRCRFEIPAYAKKATAIRKWNTRPAKDAKDKEIDSLKRTLQQIVEIANRRGHLTVATWQKDAWYGLAKIANEALNNAPDTGKMEEN